MAAGVTVKGEVFEHLAEVSLPNRIGGGPGDYQFVEDEREGEAAFVLRIDPRVRNVDEAAALSVVREELRRTETGLLADSIWSSSGSLKIERASPKQAPSGKVLPFEPLGAPLGEDANPTVS